MSRRSRHSQSAAPSSRIRSVVALGGLLVLTVVAAIFWLRSVSEPVATEPGTPGRLVASASTIDLGRVPFDQLAEARFELANPGDTTVRLIGAPKVQMLEGC
ncbi:MAG: hypothetical protein IT305_19805 [Chloroflexi bacterium]|nr:hypothetical protein [Chloroflexota bacterium]